jgi:hypothetical protein
MSYIALIYLNLQVLVHCYINLTLYILTTKHLFFLFVWVFCSPLQTFHVFCKLLPTVTRIWANTHMTVSATGRRWTMVPSCLPLAQLRGAKPPPKILSPALVTGVLYVFRGHASATHVRNRPEIVYSHWVFVPSYQTCPYMVHLVCAYFSYKAYHGMTDCRMRHTHTHTLVWSDPVSGQPHVDHPFRSNVYDENWLPNTLA